MSEDSQLCKIGWQVIYRQSIYTLSFWKRWLIRFCHSKTKWASDFCVHECGFYFDEIEAQDAAYHMWKIYGGVWMVKPLPIRSVMGPNPMKLGPTTIYGGGAKTMYDRMYKKPQVLVALPLGAIKDQELGLQGAIEQVERLWRKAKVASV
jgi:hypothetical protein